MVKRLLLAAALVGCGGSAPVEGPPPVVNVVVEPLTADVLVGQETQFSARTYAGNGSEVFGRLVQWSVGEPSVASVDEAGRARGETSGVSIVTARSGNASGSATLNVVTNEPAGFTKMLELPFSDPTWQVPLSQGWIMLPPTTYQNCGDGDGTNDGVCVDPETVDDPLFPNSPVGQHTLPQDFANNTLWPGSVGRSGGTRISQCCSTRVKETYVSFRYRFDPDWDASHLKMLGIMGPSGLQWFWVMATGSGLRFWVDQKQLNSNGSATVVVRNGGNLQPGAVHFIEVYGRMNSAPNVPDGVIKVWVDGGLRIDVADAIFYEDAAFYQRFAGVKWDPIPAARVVAPENWVRIDDIYASGR